MVPDPDPDPAIFFIALQDANQNIFLKNSFLLITFRRYIYIIFKDKKSKEVTKQKESRFFLLFLLGDRRIRILSGSRAGSIPLTYESGSGSRRPKNMWIRIRNTDSKESIPPACVAWPAATTTLILLGS
jgi:hypothetical protein